MKDRKDLTGSIKWYMSRGLSFDEAIHEIESVLHSKLPENIIAIAREELQNER